MNRTVVGWAGGEPPDDEALAAMRRMQPPDNEVPVVVPLGLLLARTDDLAVAAPSARVYSTGLLLDLLACTRLPGLELHGALHGHGGPGLLLGLEFSDGRTAANVGPDPFPPQASGGDPLLMDQGGGGGELNADASFWLTPLPPPGSLTFVVALERAGVPETRTVMDAGPLVTAAQSVTSLWPWDQPTFDAPTESADLQLPAGGWFADHVARHQQP